eukprot:jgi/Botrbrau1/9151/Bobra.160_3s0023.1
MATHTCGLVQGPLSKIAKRHTSVSFAEPSRSLSKGFTARVSHQTRKSNVSFKPMALGTGPSDKKTLKREEEPDDYWQSEAEKRGDSPFKDPLAIIGIIAILFPFIFVLIAIAFGVIDVNGGR